MKTIKPIFSLVEKEANLATNEKIQYAIKSLKLVIMKFKWTIREEWYDEW